MADLKAQLEISADASGVETGVNKAKRSLLDLGAAASTAGKQGAEGLDNVGKGGDRASQKVEAATRAMILSIQRTTASLDAGGRSGSKYFETLAAQRGIDVGVLKPYLDQLDAVAAKQKAAQQAISSSVPVLNQAGMSAKQMAFALRGVPAQFTDIAVSLQAGQSPLTVFLQQGGQLKDMFGGIGPAAQALGRYVLGLINPFTVAAAGVGAFAYAFYEGSNQSKAFSEALALTGNSAGITEGQFNALNRTIADGGKVTIGAAREYSQALLSTGQISFQVFNSAAAAAAGYSKLTGKTADEVAKDFARMAQGPTKFAEDANRSLNFLTAAQHETIKSFEENGRAADAQGVIYDALNERLKKLPGNLGFLDRALSSGKKAWSEYWDAALDAGRTETIESKIAALEKRRAAVQKAIDAPGIGALKPGQSALDTLDAEIADARKRQFRQSENAYGDALAAEINKNAIAASSVVDGYLKRGRAVTLYKQRLDELNRSFKDREMGGVPVSEADKKTALSELKKEFTDKGAINASLQINKAKLGADVDTIKKANEQLVGSYTNSEKILEAMRASGVVSDQNYYEAKRGFVRLGAEAEENALKKEIARYQQEKLTGKAKIDNDKLIYDAQEKILLLRADSSAKQEVLSIQEETANKKVARSYIDASTAAQAYIETIRRQNAREIEGVGKGRKFREDQSGLNAIEDKFTGRSQELDRDKRNNQITDDEYKKYLAIAKDTYEQEVAAYSSRTAAINAKQGDWVSGATEALNNYYDQSKDIGKGIEDLLTNSFKGMEDAFVQFTLTGKMSFSDLARSIISDIARIQARKAIAGMIEMAIGAFSGGSNLQVETVDSGAVSSSYTSMPDSLRGGRASGGPVSAGSMYEVNERGPELLNVAGKQYLMMGSQDGTVTPNGGAGGGGSVNVNVNVDASGTKSEGNNANLTQLGREFGAAVEAVLIRNKRPGGLLSN